MINIKKVKPMFNALITSMDRYEEDSVNASGIIEANKQQGGLKEYQRVLAVGNSVRDIKIGDLVCINPSRFGVKKHTEGSLKDGVITDNPIITYNFDVIVIDKQQCLLLQDRDIEFIVEEYEETTPTTPSPIIKPKEKKIIM